MNLGFFSVWHFDKCITFGSGQGKKSIYSVEYINQILVSYIVLFLSFDWMNSSNLLVLMGKKCAWNYWKMFEWKKCIPMIVKWVEYMKSKLVHGQLKLMRRGKLVFESSTCMFS